MGAVEAVTGGLGNVFSRFAIIITSGSIIGLLPRRPAECL